MAKAFSKIINILLIALLLRLFLLIISGWHPDLLNHIDWGIRFLNLGPKNFYENIFWGVSWPNQPYGTMLLFGFSAISKNIVFGIIEFLNQTFSFFPSFTIPYISANIHAWMVKMPFILSDIGLGYLIYKIVTELKPKLALLAASLFLFNPVLIYNSTIWGQTDSLINLLALSGIYLVYKKQYFWGVFLFLSTFIFKLSLVIFLPICGLIFLKRIKDWKLFIPPVITFLIFMFLLAIPFTFGDKTPFDWIWYMYTNRVLVRQGSMLNGNAFNLWVLLFGIDFSKSEFTQFIGLTYQFWGRLIYIVFLIPIWVKFLKLKMNLSRLFMALLLSSFGSFMFLTNMHERYLYPIFPLLTILIFLSNYKLKLKSLISLSIIHFLNLYNLWFYPFINSLKILLISFNFLFCRCLSFILLIVCFRYLSMFLKDED
jgi:Gpi18-like mannosyltransferase